MLFTTSIPRVIFLAALASTAAVPKLFTRTSGESAAAILLEIAPTSNTCAGAAFPSECETAEQAAPYLIKAMGTYGVSSPHEIAALLSLIAYETGDFKYARNHFPSPGRPGQGTRNMQMPNYNLLYAQSISAPSLSTITTASSADGLSDDQKNAILALLLADEVAAWGSAAWFLTTQCASARPALQAGGQAGYEAYLSCVGTSATSDRLAYWNRANTAFGIS